MKQRTDGMTFGQIRLLMKQHFAELLTQQKARILEHRRLSKHDMDLIRTTSEIAHQVSEGTPFLPDHDEAQVRSFIEHYKLPIHMGTPAAAMLGKEINRAHRSLCDAVLAYDQSLDEYELEDDKAFSPTAPPSALTPPTTLRELTGRYATDRLKGEAWTPKTARERGRQFGLLHEILGADTDVRTFTGADRERVRITLFALPKNRNKNPNTVGLSATEAMNVIGVEKLTLRTINKYLQMYTDLFRWAELSRHTASNAFEKMKVRQKKERAEHARTGFTTEQVKTMLSALLHDMGHKACRLAVSDISG